MTIEELLNTEYWIIDILPEQVPAESPGQYFAVEKYLRKTQMAEIKKKHLDLLLKLNCYRALSLDDEPEKNPSPEKIADAVCRRYVNLRTDEAMIVSEPDDTHLTLFHPDEKLLELVKTLASGEGMYVWKGRP